jgi:hypothetical protein
MAETAPTSTEPQPPPRFRPLLGGLTMMVLAVGGLIVLSPGSAAVPTLPTPPARPD